jgi:hypothetical protein
MNEEANGCVEENVWDVKVTIMVWGHGKVDEEMQVT